MTTDLNLCVITPTGDRPDALRLLHIWLMRQSIQPDLWLIIDDGRTPAVAWSRRAKIIRRTDGGPRARHTLCRNLAVALALVPKGMRCVVMEDDDWYSPNYLEAMMNLMDDGGDVVGLTPSIYYQLPFRRWKRNWHPDHASLCSTGWKYEATELIQTACYGHNDNPSVDHRIWKATGEGLCGVLLEDNPVTPLVVGIKGMPGRQGTMAGHERQPRMSWTLDATLGKLASMIGDDVRFYERFATPERVAV